MKKKIPTFRGDADAARFVDTADLREYDLSRFRRVCFNFEKKAAQDNMRLPKKLLDAVKTRAKMLGRR